MNSKEGVFRGCSPLACITWVTEVKKIRMFHEDFHSAELLHPLLTFYGCTGDEKWVTALRGPKHLYSRIVTWSKSEVVDNCQQG